MMFDDPNRVDQKLGPDPSSHPVQPAHPRGQGCQSARERSCVAKRAFNLTAGPIEFLSKRGCQQGQAATPMRALIVLAAPRILGLPARRDQLVPSFERFVVQVAGVVLSITEQVASIVKLAQQALRNFLL